MDIAIVTGAETPLGLKIVEKLVVQGFRVHGIGNNFAKVTYSDPNFLAYAIDLSDLSTVRNTFSEIVEKEKAVHLLVHAIDVTPGASFEKLPIGNLEAVLKVGLLGPVMMTRLALPNLLRFRGQLINIIPANKSGFPPSGVNSLIEGGLREMNAALFDQARDKGLRITNLILRQNSQVAENTSYEQQVQSRINPDNVVRTIEYLLNENDTNIPNEITLHPRLSSTASHELPQGVLPVDPYNTVVLPPAEYCPPEPKKILTKQKERIERTIPYTDEEMEERISAAIDDYEAHPERYEKERSKHSKAANVKNKTDRPQQESTLRKKEEDANSPSSKRRRGRRRGGKNRNRDRGETLQSEPSKEQTSDRKDSANSGQTEPAKDNKEQKQETSTKSETNQKNHDLELRENATPEETPARKRPRNRRRGDSKLKPIESVIEKFAPDHKSHDLPKKPSPKTSTEVPGPLLPGISESKVSTSKQIEKEPTSAKGDTAKPVKKAAKKRAKKAAKKKVAVKKTATKKTSAKKKAAKKTAKKPTE